MRLVSRCIERRGADEVRLPLDLLPLADERGQLALERFLGDVFADRAHDDAAGVLGEHFLDLRAKTLPRLAIADLAAHTDALGDGMKTRKRPASETCAVTRGPLVEIGSLET